MENAEGTSRLRYKGKFIKQKNYKHRIALAAAGRANKGRKVREVVNEKNEDVPQKRVKLHDEGEENTSSDEEWPWKSITTEQSVPHEPEGPITVGNRFVDLALLSEALQCNFCKEPLSLTEIVKETRKGLGSYLFIKCVHCLLVKKVPTSKCLQEKEDGRREYFEINSKAALGCIHSGIGNQPLNKLLTSIGIPPFHYSTSKYYKNKVGPVGETVAKESCDKET